MPAQRRRENKAYSDSVVYARASLRVPCFGRREAHAYRQLNYDSTVVP